MQRVALVSASGQDPSAARRFGFTGMGLMAVGVGMLSAVLSTSPTLADGGGGGGGGMAPLSRVAIPQPTGGDIVDQAAAVRLGKALFWDVQLGGDGQTACASCHYAAGADARTGSLAVNPGPDGLVGTADDVNGSAGVSQSTFIGIDADPTHPADICTPNPHAPYGSARRVTGRNAPSVINAIFNRDNFWDGRANHVFNGLNPFGLTGNASGSLVQMTNSSLASQADGPPNNPVEMACEGRSFNGPNSLGAKMLARKPLGQQQVASDDGVLGAWADHNGGLTTDYGSMIGAAFGSNLQADSVNQFSRIFGQAVQAYESTLVSDRTPLDLFLAGNRNALTSNQQLGSGIFTGKGQCTTCHVGAELTDASVNAFNANGPINRDGGDTGFHNLGVRPTSDDLGRANSGPNGVPWSVSGAPSDRGAFKTASLRNVGLTGPYFHNGGKSTLADVVAFYNRGGDFANPEKARDLKPLGMSASDQSALVDFLANGLTDCRVARSAAPFDHPSLVVPNGSARSATGAQTGACP